MSKAEGEPLSEKNGNLDGEHGYNQSNVEMALQLFLKRGRLYIPDVRNFFRDFKWVVRKEVTVPSLAIKNVRFEADGWDWEEAGRICDLMIVSELYRCWVVDTAAIELGSGREALPTDIQQIQKVQNQQEHNSDQMNDFGDMAPSATSSLTNTNTDSQTSALSASNSNNNYFLNGITSAARRSHSTMQMQRERLANQVQNYHQQQLQNNRDPTRRKFVGQQKTVDQIIEEHQQMGPVRQSQLSVQVFNNENGEQFHETISSFADVQLSLEIRKTLSAMSYQVPTDVQKCVIPLIQKTNNDILCLAQTGSGKTGAFLIPIVHRLQGLRVGPQSEQKPTNTNAPLAIIVAHTRELVEQLYNTARSFARDTGVGVALARGQLPSFERRRQLTNGCDILVVTPGTLNQYMEEKWISVANVHFIVIDEADKFIAEDDFARMLLELKKNIEQTNNSQFRTLLFSATLNEVATLIVSRFVRLNHYQVIAGRVNQAAQHVKQELLEVRSNRMKMLLELLRKHSRQVPPKNGEHFCFDTPRTLIFVNSGRVSDRVAIVLSFNGFRAMSVNGHRSMEQRHKAVDDFKQGHWHILVGTDVIARGMNFPKVDHVIMYQLPLIVRYEQYVHRVGRTGRTGVADGKASVFFDPKDPNDLQLTEFLGEQIRESNQQVPRFLRELEENRASQREMVIEHRDPPPNSTVQAQASTGNNLQSTSDEGFANTHWTL